jgi:hypothetical protein
VLDTISDLDSFGGAPSSESDSDGGSSNNSSSLDESINAVYHTGNTDNEDGSDIAENSCSGLHWENGTHLGELHYKMHHCSTAVKECYKHLFITPIDSMLALLSYIFWELMVDEVNRYSSNCCSEKNTRHILGSIWKPVTVSEMLKYFGMLLYATLYPLTGRRVRSCWDYPTLLPWTLKMTKGRFMQISSMLHFNNNDDADRMGSDSLHKVHPLLKIIKRTLGKFAQPGSEFSYDEATMACFSRYGRNLISFNPKKPTGICTASSPFPIVTCFNSY